jgi:RNA polymerase sigma-70 factor (ECF subfamily)
MYLICEYMKYIDISKDLMEYQNELFRFAVKLTRNRDDASDLLQETSLKVLNNQEKFAEETNFRAWAYTLMRNIFINNYRKTVREQTFVDQTENLYHLNIPQNSGFNSPEGSYSISEITMAINGFSKEYRLPFAMHIAGYKYEDIAKELQLPLGTVKSRIFFARKRLQQILKDYR